MLGVALVKEMGEVFANTKDAPSITIHAAMLLPTMAKLKNDSVNDYLIGLIENDKTDEPTRLYALKAFKESMPITVQPDPVLVLNLAAADQNAKRASDTKLVEALVKYIERRVKTEELSYEEIAAVRFLRREAIISLASAGSPAVLLLKAGVLQPKNPERKDGLVAPTLLRVWTKDGLEPPASLQEKIDAAHGLCAMKYPFVPEYNPDVAVYLIGKTLDEFIGEYKRDYANFKGPDRRLPRIAWKTESKRFETGLKDLAENAKGVSSKAAQLRDAATPILKRMQTYNQPEEGEFRTRLVPSLRPKTGYLFGPIKTAEIPLD